jgi:hypothetical protein
MNQLVPFTDRAPALVAAGERASYRFFEFFTAQIRNPNTRRAYARAAVEFFDWLAARGVTQITAIESVHIAAYIEQLQKARSAPTAKLRLAALRHLFDWMVIGQIMPLNPATAVRGPRHIVTVDPPLRDNRDTMEYPFLKKRTSELPFMRPKNSGWRLSGIGTLSFSRPRTALRAIRYSHRSSPPVSPK